MPFPKKRIGSGWKPYAANNDNPLVWWLKEKGFWVTSQPLEHQQRLPLTHVFLNGGKASVPDSARSLFHKKYCEALLSGYDQFVVERTVGQKFKMFMDIDIKYVDLVDRVIKDGDNDDATPDADRVVRCVLERVMYTMERLLPNTSAVIAMRISEDEEKKRGLHVVWDAPVTKQEAMQLREQCVSAAAAQRPTLNWNDIIDGAVYRNNGLRMIMSLKGGGSYARYVPSFTFEPANNADGEDGVTPLVPVGKDYLTDLCMWVDRFSIHLCAPPPPLSDAVKVEDGEIQSNRDFDTYGLSEHGKGLDAATLEKSRYGGISAADGVSVHEMSDEIQELRELLPPPFSNARFTSIHGKPSERFPRFVISTDSRYCLNYQKEHRSNRVYLSVEREGVFQCCFCTCDTDAGRRYGKCSDVKVKLLSVVPRLFGIALTLKLGKNNSGRNEACEEAANESSVAPPVSSRSVTKPDPLGDMLRRVEQRLDPSTVSFSHDRTKKRSIGTTKKARR